MTFKKMAAEVRTSCVKCNLKLEKPIDKILKCSGNCNNFVHHSCSVFKPTELKLFEVYKDNIKWFCDTCTTRTKDNLVNELYVKVASLDNKIDKFLGVIYDQSIKIEKQNSLLNRLEINHKI